jgi:hypothetical protein
MVARFRIAIKPFAAMGGVPALPKIVSGR